jgi:hypothetical protein
LFEPSVAQTLLKHMALPVLVCPGAEG